MSNWVLFCAEVGDTAIEHNPVLFVSGDLLAAETIDTLGRVYPDLTFTRLDSGKFTPSHRNALREIMNQALRGELSDLYRRVALSAFECQENTLLALERAEEKGNLPKEITSEELHGMLRLLPKTAGSKDDVKPSRQGDMKLVQNDTSDGDAGIQIDEARRLRRSYLSAYRALEYAQKKTGRKLTVHEAFEWLAENEIEDDEASAELYEYELPKKATFKRYVTAARKAIGNPKNRSRSGRTSRSIVSSDEI